MKKDTIELTVEHYEKLITAFEKIIVKQDEEIAYLNAEIKQLRENLRNWMSGKATLADRRQE